VRWRGKERWHRWVPSALREVRPAPPLPSAMPPNRGGPPRSGPPPPLSATARPKSRNGQPLPRLAPVHPPSSAVPPSSPHPHPLRGRRPLPLLCCLCFPLLPLRETLPCSYPRPSAFICGSELLVPGFGFRVSGPGSLPSGVGLSSCQSCYPVSSSPRVPSYLRSSAVPPSFRPVPGTRDPEPRSPSSPFPICVPLRNLRTQLPSSPHPHPFRRRRRLHPRSSAFICGSSLPSVPNLRPSAQSADPSPLFSAPSPSPS